MTSERTQAYGRIVKTLEDLGPAKLLASEQERIREAADTLIFASGPTITSSPPSTTSARSRITSPSPAAGPMSAPPRSSTTSPRPARWRPSPRCKSRAGWFAR